MKARVRTKDLQLRGWIEQPAEQVSELDAFYAAQPWLEDILATSEAKDPTPRTTTPGKDTSNLYAYGWEWTSDRPGGDPFGGPHGRQKGAGNCSPSPMLTGTAPARLTTPRSGAPSSHDGSASVGSGLSSTESLTKAMQTSAAIERVPDV